MDYKEILNKYYNGDAIDDSELDALSKQLHEAATALEPLRHEPYSLVLRDIYNKISTLESFRHARKLR